MIDLTPQFVQFAQKRCPNSICVCDDVLVRDLRTIAPRYINAVTFTNSSGYFSLKDLQKLLPKFPGRYLIANFLIEDDQKWAPVSNLLLAARNQKYRYNFGSETLELNSIKEKDLHRIFHDSGYRTYDWFSYHDFKTERLYFASR